jgi:SAM-dependent methyltransferase
MGNDGYFSHVRSEIEPLLPQTARRVLDVGCGEGATLGWLRRRWPSAILAGVDRDEGCVSRLAQVADLALQHDLETPLPELEPFDLILALDVLEHLREPAIVLGRLTGLLAPGGRIIVSLPNVAHHSVIRGLLRRRFDYADAGILDRTHLRFFTERSALALMRDAGLSVEQGMTSGFSRRKPRRANKLTLGLFRHYLTEQYIMSAVLDGAGQAPPERLRWGYDMPSGPSVVTGASG